MKEFLEFVVSQLIDRPEECVLRDDERAGTHALPAGAARVRKSAR